MHRKKTIYIALGIIALALVIGLVLVMVGKGNHAGTGAATDGNSQSTNDSGTTESNGNADSTGDSSSTEGGENAGSAASEGAESPDIDISFEIEDKIPDDTDSTVNVIPGDGKTDNPAEGEGTDNVIDFKDLLNKGDSTDK